MSEIKVPENGKYIHIPSLDWKKDDETGNIKTITLSVDKGIKALFNVEKKKIFSFMFDKKKWSKEEAKAWIEKKANESFEIDKASLQQTAIDAITEEFELNESSMDVLWKDLERLGKESDYIAIINALTQLIFKNNYFLIKELERLEKVRPRDARLKKLANKLSKITNTYENDFRKIRDSI